MITLYHLCQQHGRTELLSIARLALPMMLGLLLQFFMNVTSTIYVGHLQPYSAGYLAASGMAVLYTNMAGLSVQAGLASALDTLCAQAYGAGQLPRLGQLYQRATVWLMICSLPSALTYWYCAAVLRSLGQDEIVAEQAGAYVRWLIPGLFAYTQLEALKRFLASQHIAHLYPIASACANVTHALICYLFIYVFDLGYIGAAIATSCSMWINFLSLAALAIYGGHLQASWPGLIGWDVFHGWGQLWQLGFPGMLMLCLEWWCFEICAMLSGLLGTLQLEALVVVMNFNALVFMVPLGLSISLSVLVGNHLGANQPDAARQTASIGIAFTFAITTSISLLGFGLRTFIGRMFSGDETVVSLVRSSFSIVAVFMLFDGVQNVCSGVFRGSGLQRVGAMVNLGSYYIVALPAAYLCAFQLTDRLGLADPVHGIWVGLACGVFTASVVSAVVISRVDWSEQARVAQHHIDADPDVSNAADSPDNAKDTMTGNVDNVVFQPVVVIDLDIDARQVELATS